MNTKSLLINIFEYTDYRRYLRDRYAELKKNKVGISYRALAARAGFSSPNYIKLVIDGNRNASNESVEKLIHAFSLNQSEARYFRNLVSLEQATTDSEREFYREAILKNKSFRKAAPLTKAKFDYYQNWYHIPLREMVDLKDFRYDPKWIASQLLDAISEKQVAEAYESLERLGLIRRSKDGKLSLVDKSIQADGNVVSDLLIAFHKKMIQKGADSIETVHHDEREISTTTIGVSEKTAQKVKNKIQKLHEEILELAAQEQDANRVYQINFQFFPLTKKEGTK